MSDDAAEIERLTTRIRQVELAKSLAARGAYAEALELLRTVRERYDEAQRRQVDRLITEYSRAAEGEPPSS